MIAYAPTLTALNPDDPELIALMRRALEKFGDMPRYLPKTWLGVKDATGLRACIGIMPVDAGVRIDYLLFDGKVSGFRQMIALGEAVNEKFKGYDVFFNVKADNMLMRAFVEGLGAKQDWIGYRRDAR